MSSPGLPSELLLRVVDFLPQPDLISFSTANFAMRKLLQPNVFRTLKFTNRKKDIPKMLNLTSEYGHKARKIHYECYMSPLDIPSANGWMTYDFASSPYFRLEDQASTLLSNESLPNVTSLRVSFRPVGEFTGDGWESRGDDDRDPTEHQLRAQRVDAAHIWRQFIYDTITGIQKMSNITNLCLYDLPPVGSSAFSSGESWVSFLENIRDMDIQIHCGYKPTSTATQAFLRFIPELQYSIFCRLSNAASLRLAYHLDSPIGGPETQWNSPVPFRPDDLPCLEELELSNCYLDASLLDFLEPKGGQLRSLRLYSGMAVWNNAESYDWAELTSEIRTNHPSLQKFIIDNEQVVLREETSGESCKP